VGYGQAARGPQVRTPSVRVVQHPLAQSALTLQRAQQVAEPL
jgi:hypothetical protein